MKKVLVDLVVKEVEQVNANCVLLVMSSDTPFPEVRPGQFAELRIDQTPTVMLRRPISVHSFDAEKNEIGFLVQVVGDGTKWLGTLKAGDDLVNADRGSKERIAQLFCSAGANRVAVDELKAGDLGCTVKLKDIKIGNTLNAKDCNHKFALVENLSSGCAVCN